MRGHFATAYILAHPNPPPPLFPMGVSDDGSPTTHGFPPSPPAAAAEEEFVDAVYLEIAPVADDHHAPSPGSSDGSRQSAACPICMEPKEGRVRPCAGVSGSCVATVCTECLALMVTCPFCRLRLRPDTQAEAARRRRTPPILPPSFVPSRVECAFVLVLVAALVVAYPLLLRYAAANGHITLPGAVGGRVVAESLAVVTYTLGTLLMTLCMLRWTGPAAFADHYAIVYLGPPLVRVFQVSVMVLAHVVAFTAMYISPILYVSCGVSLIGHCFVSTMAMTVARRVFVM